MGSEKQPLLKDRGKAISNAETICGEKKTKVILHAYITAVVAWCIRERVKKH